MCGTRTGYNAHYKRKEKPCDACKLAHKNYYIAWRKNNPDKVKKMIEKDRTLHKERYLQTVYAWAKTHPERIKEIRKKHNQKNPQRGLKHDRARRARKLGIGHEPYTDKQVLDTYGSLCHICGIAIDLTAPRVSTKEGWQLGLHIDHLIPLSKGGVDNLSNVRPSHAQCNLRKGSKSSLP
jgi:5-methylcytosine-specific restriction endonuclease McrA